MVCRTNAASSVAIALARAGSWLDDAQVQSIVHRLRHEYSGSQPPPGWNRAEYLSRELQRAENAIETNSNFRPQRRAGLRARLARAREVDDGLPDGSPLISSRFEDASALHAGQEATGCVLRQLGVDLLRLKGGD